MFFLKKVTLKIHKNLVKDVIKVDTTILQVIAFNCTGLFWEKKSTNNVQPL